MATKLNDLELTPGRLVGEGHPAFIIAEIGQNHQGTEMFNLCHFFCLKKRNLKYYFNIYLHALIYVQTPNTEQRNTN